MTHTKWRVVAELAASQHGAFHRNQAADHLSTRTLRRAELRGDLRRVLSDVYILRAFPVSWKQNLSALSLAGGLISHRAAAALHGLDGFATGKLEITISPFSNRGWLPNTTLHESVRRQAVDRCVVDTIACTTVERTLVDLGQVVPQFELEAALDAALRRGVSLGSIEAALDRLDRPGPTGVGPLRRLLADPARAGALPDSMFERLVERMVLGAGFSAPQRQFEVMAQGRTWRVDLAWPRQRVAVEAHSKRWHFGRAATDHDNARDLALAAAGWEVLYLTWAQAQEPSLFLEQLRSVLDQRAA